MAFGMEQAIKAAGLQGKVEIIGNGASAVGVSAVKAGRWHSTVVLLPHTEGRIATEYVVRAARGATGLPTSIDVERLSPIGPVATKATVGTFKPEWRG
jgi:ABC-type sugar transport system substrate-binding protein